MAEDTNNYCYKDEYQQSKGVEMELRNFTMEMCIKNKTKAIKCKEKTNISRNGMGYMSKGTGRNIYEDEDHKI